MQTVNLTTRKYYLNRRVKAFCGVNSRRRIISITEAGKQALAGKQKSYIDELTQDFRYKIQYKMPV